MELDFPVEDRDALLFVANMMLEQLILRATARALALSSVNVTLALEGSMTPRARFGPRFRRMTVGFGSNCSISTLKPIRLKPQFLRCHLRLNREVRGMVARFSLIPVSVCVSKNCTQKAQVFCK